MKITLLISLLAAMSSAPLLAQEEKEAPQERSHRHRYRVEIPQQYWSQMGREWARMGREYGRMGREYARMYGNLGKDFGKGWGRDFSRQWRNDYRGYSRGWRDFSRDFSREFGRSWGRSFQWKDYGNMYWGRPRKLDI